MKIDVYSHSVVITPEGGKQKQVVRDFLKRLIQWDQVTEDGETKLKAIRTYATHNTTTGSFSFHIHLLKEFFDYYNENAYVKGELDITVHEFKIDDSFRVEFKVKSIHEPRENQKNVINHLLERKPEPSIYFDGLEIPFKDNNKIVTMPTGEGKTFVSQYVMIEEGLRTIFMMRSSYIERWVPDLENTVEMKAGDIQVVQGAASLRAIMENAQDDVDRAKIYLISTNTFTSYLDSYDALGDQCPFPVAPHDFFKVLKVGSTVLDEGHQLPHQIMKYYTHLHVNKQTVLSATLDTLDKFMDKILKIMYPVDKRFSGGIYAAHIKVTALRYKLGNPRRIQYQGFKGYSHTKFESSLMSKKNQAIKKDYFDLVGDLLEERYLGRNLEGTKALVFFATIQLCTEAVEYLQPRFPNKKLVRYTSKDKMSVIDEGEIIISTIQSCGTAVDIPNLVVSIMTTAVDSQQSNEQTVGRTRKLKSYPNEAPEFIYFLCDNIQKHYDYHRNKVKFFKNKAISHDLEDTDKLIGRPSQDGAHSNQTPEQSFRRPWNQNGFNRGQHDSKPWNQNFGKDHNRKWGQSNFKSNFNKSAKPNW